MKQTHDKDGKILYIGDNIVYIIYVNMGGDNLRERKLKGTVFDIEADGNIIMARGEDSNGNELTFKCSMKDVEKYITLDEKLDMLEL